MYQQQTKGSNNNNNKPKGQIKLGSNRTTETTINNKWLEWDITTNLTTPSRICQLHTKYMAIHTLSKKIWQSTTSTQLPVSIHTAPPSPKT
jgi:hypothetical protein